MRSRSRAWWCAVVLFACAPPDDLDDVGPRAPGGHAEGRADVLPPDPVVEVPPDPPPTPPNLLFILLDDVGSELIGVYGHPDAVPPPTPTFDALAAEGVRFTNAWANPWCSPSRAAIFTGQHPRRLGIGRAIEPFEEYTGLSRDEITWMERLADASPWDYRRALFGKWHMTAASHGPDAPLDHGIEHFSGTLGNLTGPHAFDGQPQNYRDWEQIVNGEVRRVEGYVTSYTIDEALAWITAQSEPWAVWIGMHAAHAPRHVPPQDLHTYGEFTDEVGVWRARAMIEAADHEIGRLLDGLDPDVRARTVVVVAGDNGTPTALGLGPFAGRPGKSTVFELGLRVPLVIAGPVVTRPGVVDAVVQLSDLHDTFAELGGVELDPRDTPDSVSLVPYLRDPDHPPLRSWVYAEAFTPNAGDTRRAPSDQRAASDGTWKLMRRDGHTTLHRIEGTLFDGPHVPDEELDDDARAARDLLAAVLDGN